jgi:hypothetical protein
MHVSRPVVHFCSGHELAALRDASDEHGLEVGTSSIDCGRVASRAGTEDEDFGVFHRETLRARTVALMPRLMYIREKDSNNDLGLSRHSSEVGLVE